MAIEPGWSSWLNEKFGFGGGSRNSAFKEKWFLIGVEVMVKKKKENIVNATINFM